MASIQASPIGPPDASVTAPARVPVLASSAASVTAGAVTDVAVASPVLGWLSCHSMLCRPVESTNANL